MKIVLAITAIVVSAFGGFFQSGPLPIGSAIPKPDLKMKDVSGKLVSLQDIRTSQGLLVMFSCNTCPYVIKNQARTRSIAEYAQGKNIGVILLNSNEGSRGNEESYRSMQQYAASQSYHWPYAVDSNNELADAFGASRTPEVYLFDAKGRLVYRGAIDDSPADDSKVRRIHLQEAIDEMLSGKTVSIQESRSIGCSIKRKG